MAFLIGVAGASGTGKTKFAEFVRKVFKNVNHFSLDDYHKYGREERKRLGITPLNPKANDFKLMYEHIKKVKEDNKIIKPVYDHSVGVIIPNAEVFVPEKIVVIEGLLPFYKRSIAKLFDLKLFFDVSESIRLKWKIQRDKTQRGYKREFDLKQRKVDYVKYILPQKKTCDIVVEVDKSKKFKGMLKTKLVFKKGSFVVPVKAPLQKGSIEIEKNSVLLEGVFTKNNFDFNKLLKNIPQKMNAFTTTQLLIIHHLERLFKQSGAL